MDDYRQRRQRHKSDELFPSEMMYEHGKILPQAIDCEEAVLGCLMLEASIHYDIFRILDPKAFYKPAHVLICQAIIDLKKMGAGIDILTVTERLRAKGELETVGGPYYVTMLTNRVASTAHLEWHYRIIQEKWMRRRIIQISNTLMKAAYSDEVDVFDLVDKAPKEFEFTNLARREKISTENARVSTDVFETMTTETPKGIMLFYKTRWPIFDSRVISGSNKIILVAGGAKMGKTKFVTMWVADLLEQYQDIAVDWVTLEDGAADIVAHYLASKVFVKGKDLKKRNFNPGLMPIIQRYIDKWSSFDIEFIDQSIKIEAIAAHFRLFCERRPNKFHILIVDNVLSLKDRNDFKNDLNGFYDFAMNEILNIRQITKALIIVVHHFKDAQQDKENLKDGYRPRLTDIKGTEAFRRVPNQVLLINTPGKYKDLLAQYKGDRKENLKKMFIVDVGASREDDNIDVDDGVIHMFASLDYNVFREIDYFDPTKGVEGSYVTEFTPPDDEPF